MIGRTLRRTFGTTRGASAPPGQPTGAGARWRVGTNDVARDGSGGGHGTLVRTVAVVCGALLMLGTAVLLFAVLATVQGSAPFTTCLAVSRWLIQSAVVLGMATLLALLRKRAPQ